MLTTRLYSFEAEIRCALGVSRVQGAMIKFLGSTANVVKADASIR